MFAVMARDVAEDAALIERGFSYEGVGPDVHVGPGICAFEWGELVVTWWYDRAGRRWHLEHVRQATCYGEKRRLTFGEVLALDGVLRSMARELAFSSGHDVAA